jgi:hypothetical protein
MKRADAYALLADELQRWQRMPYRDLVAQIDAAPPSTSAAIGPESIEIQVCARWADPGRNAIRVEAIANGPSHWRLERLIESVVVREPKDN